MLEKPNREATSFTGRDPLLSISAAAMMRARRRYSRNVSPSRWEQPVSQYAARRLRKRTDCQGKSRPCSLVAADPILSSNNRRSFRQPRESSSCENVLSQQKLDESPSTPCSRKKLDRPQATINQLLQLSIFQTALGHYQNGRLADAEIFCQQALKIHPQNADALHLLGVVYLQDRQYEKAAGLIADAIKQNSENPHYFSHLASALQNLNQPDEALECFRLAIQLEPDFVEAYNNRGNLLLKIGRPTDALEKLREGCFHQTRFFARLLQRRSSLEDSAKAC